jgi:hypothetical protein
MIVRSLTPTGDWSFGRGKSDYKQGRDAIAQSISTRLKSFLGDCFFELDAGIDWFNLISAKRQGELNLSISATILNTNGVVSLVGLNLMKSSARNLIIKY